MSPNLKTCFSWQIKSGLQTQINSENLGQLIFLAVAYIGHVAA